MGFGLGEGLSDEQQVAADSSPSQQFSDFQVPEYEIGETAKVDVVTPVRLVVMDPEATEKLRQQEATRTPAIFRFDTNVAARAEPVWRSALTNNQRKFLDALEVRFNQRQIDVQMDAVEFERLVAVFQRQNRSAPLSTNLARLWASGESAEPLLQELGSKFRSIQTNFIRADGSPASSKIGPIRIVTATPDDPPLDLETVNQRAITVARTNVHNLSAARRQLQNALSGDLQVFGRFLAGFVRTNCFFEQELTEQIRERRTSSIFVTQTYEPGQPIVRSNELVTAGTKAALTELKTRLLANDGHPRQETAFGALQAGRSSTLELGISNAALRSNLPPWWLWAPAAAGLLCLAGVWFYRRSTHQPSLAIVPTPSGSTQALQLAPDNSAIACPSCSQTIVLSIKSVDAVPSDAPDGKLKAALLPHMARWLAHKLFRRVMWHRVYLMETQRRAEMEVAEMENRLAQMHAPLQQRLKAYETRINELQDELAAAREENRQLIKAQIDLMQKKLDAERAKEPDWPA